MTPTNLAHCPKCNSALYTPDPSNGGAGRNKCLGCGEATPVVYWYKIPNLGPIFATRHDHPISDYRIAVTSDRRLMTDTPAAPIRQYKDD